jgi:hypothetical protein
VTSSNRRFEVRERAVTRQYVSRSPMAPTAYTGAAPQRGRPWQAAAGLGRLTSAGHSAVVNIDNKRWSLYGAPWLQPVAIGGKSAGHGGGENRRKPLPSVDGKEGVDGSSPSEGFEFSPA